MSASGEETTNWCHTLVDATHPLGLDEFVVKFTREVGVLTCPEQWSTPSGKVSK